MGRGLDEIVGFKIEDKAVEYGVVARTDIVLGEVRMCIGKRLELKNFGGFLLLNFAVVVFDFIGKVVIGSANINTPLEYGLVTKHLKQVGVRERLVFMTITWVDVLDIKSGIEGKELLVVVIECPPCKHGLGEGSVVRECVGGKDRAETLFVEEEVRESDILILDYTYHLCVDRGS